jgi:hypothetical protein
MHIIDGSRTQCSVFIATSLDGFIARPDGAIDSLFAPVGRDVLLERVSTTAFPFGFVQSTYRVAPSATAGK